MEFPRFVYRKIDKKVKNKTVIDETEFFSAIQYGWFDKVDQIVERVDHGQEAKQEGQKEVLIDRDVLKREALILGLTFPSNIPTQKLIDMVDTARKTNVMD